MSIGWWIGSDVKGRFRGLRIPEFVLRVLGNKDNPQPEQSCSGRDYKGTRQKMEVVTIWANLLGHAIQMTLYMSYVGCLCIQTFPLASFVWWQSPGEVFSSRFIRAGNKVTWLWFSVCLFICFLIRGLAVSCGGALLGPTYCHVIECDNRLLSGLDSSCLQMTFRCYTRTSVHSHVFTAVVW
jgi:hypothetical protein